MQEKNKTQSQMPKSGEEFIENAPSVESTDSIKMSGSDEGVPTFSGTRPPGTPERATEEDRRNQRGHGFEGSD